MTKNVAIFVTNVIFIANLLLLHVFWSLNLLLTFLVAISHRS